MRREREIMTSIKGRPFKTIEEAVESMKLYNWKMLAGSTSNCQTHYDVVGIGETVDGLIVAILDGTYQGRIFMAPSEMVVTCGGPLAMGNYGTPQTASSIEDAVKSFNNDYDRKNCNWDICRVRPIDKITWKDGRTVEYMSQNQPHFMFENGVATLNNLETETFHRLFNPSIFEQPPSFDMVVNSVRYRMSINDGLRSLISVFLPEDAHRLSEEILSQIYYEHNEFIVESIRIKTDGVSDPEMRSIMIDHINKCFIDMKYDVNVSCVNDIVSISVDMWTHTRGRKHF